MPGPPSRLPPQALQGLRRFPQDTTGLRTGGGRTLLPGAQPGQQTARGCYAVENPQLVASGKGFYGLPALGMQAYDVQDHPRAPGTAPYLDGLKSHRRPLVPRAPVPSGGEAQETEGNLGEDIVRLGLPPEYRELAVFQGVGT